MRGGYAIFFPGTFNINYFGNTAGYASTTTTYSSPGGNGNLPSFYLKDGFPTPLTQPLGSILGPSYLLGSAVTYDQSIQKTPMSQQWNFAIQKQVFGGWVVDASYTGNRGTHLVAGNYNLDQLNPQYEAAGKRVVEFGAQSVRRHHSRIARQSRPFRGSSRCSRIPYYTSVTVRNPHLGNSMYHAGLLTVQKRMHKGLTFLASYTKAKLIDDSVASPINFGSIEQVNNNRYQNGLYNRAWSARSIPPTFRSASP